MRPDVATVPLDNPEYGIIQRGVLNEEGLHFVEVREEYQEEDKEDSSSNFANKSLKSSFKRLQIKEENNTSKRNPTLSSSSPSSSSSSFIPLKEDQALLDYIRKLEEEEEKEESKYESSIESSGHESNVDDIDGDEEEEEDTLHKSQISDVDIDIDMNGNGNVNDDYTDHGSDIVLHNEISSPPFKENFQMKQNFGVSICSPYTFPNIPSHPTSIRSPSDMFQVMRDYASKLNIQGGLVYPKNPTFENHAIKFNRQIDNQKGLHSSDELNEEIDGDSEEEEEDDREEEEEDGETDEYEHNECEHGKEKEIQNKNIENFENDSLLKDVSEKNIMNATPEEIESYLHYKEVAEEYHKKRQQRIKAQTSDIVISQQEYERLDILDHLSNDQSVNTESIAESTPKKISRFKAARIAGRQRMI